LATTAAQPPLIFADDQPVGVPSPMDVKPFDATVQNATSQFPTVGGAGKALVVIGEFDVVSAAVVEVETACKIVGCGEIAAAGKKRIAATPLVVVGIVVDGASAVDVVGAVATYRP
jgi:hypothetical protein